MWAACRSRNSPGARPGGKGPRARSRRRAAGCGPRSCERPRGGPTVAFSPALSRDGVPLVDTRCLRFAVAASGHRAPARRSTAHDARSRRGRGRRACPGGWFARVEPGRTGRTPVPQDDAAAPAARTRHRAPGEIPRRAWRSVAMEPGDWPKEPCTSSGISETVEPSREGRETTSTRCTTGRITCFIHFFAGRRP